MNKKILLIITIAFFAGTVITSSINNAYADISNPFGAIITALNNIKTAITGIHPTVNVSPTPITINAPAGPQGSTGPKGDTGPAGTGGSFDPTSLQNQINALGLRVSALETQVCPLSSDLGFVYEGKVTSSDGGPSIPFTVSVDDKIKGVYCYSPTSPNTDPNHVGFGEYALSFETVRIGNHDLSCTIGVNSHLEVINNTPNDQYSVYCDAGTNVIPVASLTDSTHTALSDNSLPQTAPDVSKFDNKQFEARWGAIIDANIVHGSITSIIKVQ